MTLLWFLGLYAAVAILIWTMLRAKNSATPSSVQHMEDAEQMMAIGRRAPTLRVEPDPCATLT